MAQKKIHPSQIDAYINISVRDFGAVGDGVADDTAALQAARDYIAAQSKPTVLTFPAGVYKYSASPNWAITHLQMKTDGVVYMQYTGVENAFIVDAGTSGYAWGIDIGYFYINCPSTAKNAVYIRSIHRSKFGFNVRGAGSGYAGLKQQFGVCNKFDNYICSNNEGAWYSTSAPTYGLDLDLRDAGEQSSYCTFNNPIIEGCSYGIYCRAALGNTFNGGTSEGNSNVGIWIPTAAVNNKFFNVDLEFNTTADILCDGTGNEFYGCDSDSYILLQSNATHNKFFGGNYKTIELLSGALANSFTNVVYNRYSGGAFSNSGTGTVCNGVVDMVTDKALTLLPVVQTATGTQSCATATPTTFYTASSPAIYMVNVWYPSNEAGNPYFGVAIISTDGTTRSKIHFSNFGAVVSISMSDLNMQVQQLSGITLTMNWSVLRLS